VFVHHVEMHEFWLWCGFKNLKILVKILKNNCENLCKRFEKDLKRKEKNKQTQPTSLPRGPSPLSAHAAHQRQRPLPLPHVVTDRWGPHVGPFSYL
jgi:hypothetical protein